MKKLELLGATAMALLVANPAFANIVRHHEGALDSVFARARSRFAAGDGLRGH